MKEQTLNGDPILLTRKVLTVDPGISGGFALWEETKYNGKPTLVLLGYDRLPVMKANNRIDGYTLYAEFAYINLAYMFIEKVGSMPGNAGQSMFNFGVSYGIMLGLAHSIGVEVIEVTPMTWQNVAHKGMSRNTPTKQRSNRAVYEAFHIKLKATDDGVADAICLGLYVKSLYEKGVIK